MSENEIPAHIGFILDGNRRWARDRNLPSMSGHLAGYNNLRDLAIYLLKEKKVKYLSAFVFSTENWKRSREEVSYLMQLVHRALTEYLDDFHRNNIKVMVLGSRENLSKRLLKAINEAEAKTLNNSGGNLALCFNYGGQQEIVDAFNKILSTGPSQKSISIKDIYDAAYYPEVPDIDLIVRTSGEQRLSGFMLWRAAYAELLFVDKHWPDFGKEDLNAAIEEYGLRHRRYGA
jgi:undecaprenyl diphosphate synthase